MIDSTLNIQTGCVKCGCLFYPKDVHTRAKTFFQQFQYTTQIPQVCYDCLITFEKARSQDPDNFLFIQELEFLK